VLLLPTYTYGIDALAHSFSFTLLHPSLCNPQSQNNKEILPSLSRWQENSLLTSNSIQTPIKSLSEVRQKNLPAVRFVNVPSGHGEGMHNWYNSAQRRRNRGLPGNGRKLSSEKRPREGAGGNREPGLGKKVLGAQRPPGPSFSRQP
jgi:hypothetical protein